jgi:hypothetical protein
VYRYSTKNFYEQKIGYWRFLLVVFPKITKFGQTDGDEVEISPPGMAEEGVVDTSNIGGCDGGCNTRQIQKQASIRHLNNYK